MKSIKSLISILFFTISFGVQAHRVPLSAEERALVLTFRMGKYMQLTEPQKASILKIHQNAFEKIDITRNLYRENKPLLKKARKKIFEIRNAELQQVLTREQFEFFKQQENEEHEKMTKAREAFKARLEKKSDTSLPTNPPAGKRPTPQK